MIDTLETSKRLRAAGFDEAQAEALVGMVRDAREADLARLATKDDLAQLATDLRGEIGQLRAELRGEMGQLRGELTTQIAQLETRLMLRLGAMIAAGVAFLTAIKFFS